MPLRVMRSHRKRTEDMGNQNGTVSSSGGAAPEVNSSTTAAATSNGTSNGTSNSSSRTNQRRATSPGMPNRTGRKGARSVQSTAGGTPAPPPPTKPAHMQSGGGGPHQQQQQAASAQNQAKGNEFVDFIYDYATKEGGENGNGGEESTNRKNKAFDAVVAGDLAGHREHVDKKQGRGERARAHTHGHAARKHKSPASKPNTKSTLVVDYIDASHNPQTYSAGLTVPDLNVGGGDDSDPQFDDFSRPKAATESKPHRERARAHSHGHRKKGSSDSKNKGKGTSSSSDTSEREPVVNLLAVPPKPAKPTENGQSRTKLSASTNELDDTRDEKSHEVLPDVSLHDTSMTDKYDHLTDKNKRPGTPPGEGQDNGVSSAEFARLRQENSRLRKELSENRKDSKKIESMEAEIKKLKLREAEDAKTLETMVQHVEANLKRTTERAVTAENTITKLKAEIKQLKSKGDSSSSSGKQDSKENRELKDIRDKANEASLKLATAAKEAETNVKQLMSGVEVLKLLAETLGCIDRITEDKSDKPKSFGTAL